MAKRYVFMIVALATVGLFGTSLAQKIIDLGRSADVNNLPWVIPADPGMKIEPKDLVPEAKPAGMMPEPVLIHPIPDNLGEPNTDWDGKRYKDIRKKPRENMGLLFPKPATRVNDYVKGQLVIGFKTSMRGKYECIVTKDGILKTGIKTIDALNAKYGAKGHKKIHEELFPAAYTHGLDLHHVFYLDEKLDLEAVAKEYRNDPSVQFAHPDYIPMVKCITKAPWAQTGIYSDIKQVAPNYPNDPRFDWSPSILQVARARTVTTASGNGDGTGGARPDTFLMLDPDQIRPTHEEFANGRIAATGGTTPTGTTNNQHGHMCVGHAIAAMNNGLGIAGPGGGNGTTPGILCAYYRYTSSSDNATGISWGIARGVCAIAQASLYFANTQVLEAAFKAALDAGAPAYISAGNDRNYDSNMYPAYYECVEAVGGIDWAGRHWAWDDTSGSCYGDWVDICGPADAQWTANSGADNAYIDGYGGTSWAAPEVAAIAALCHHVTGLTGEALRRAVRRSANSNDHLNTNLDALTIPAGAGGAGIANAYEAVMVRDRNASVDFVSINSARNNYLNHGDLYLQSAMQPNPDLRDTLFKNDAIRCHGIWQFDRSIVPNVEIFPKAMVHNRGISQVSFNVTATNGSSYTSTKTVTLGSGKGTLVTFDGWRPTGTGAEVLTVYSDLTGDQNRLNDTVRINLTKIVGIRDTVQLSDGQFDVDWSDPNAAWAVKFEPERTCTLTHIRFYRMRKITIGAAPAWACSLRVWDAQSGKPGTSLYSQAVTWASGGADGWGQWFTIALTTPQVISKPVYIGLKTWGGGGTGGTAGTNDTFRIGFDYRRNSRPSYYYVGNVPAWQELGNDPAIIPIVGYRSQFANDIGIDVVHAPEYGSLVKGFAYVPKAKVTNYGSNPFTGNIFCHMDSVGATRVQKLASTRTVTNLAPGATQELVFDPVVLGGTGTTTYTMDVTVARSSGTDDNTHNDSIRTVMDTVRATAVLTAGEGSAAFYTSANRIAAVRFVPPGACQVTAGRAMYYRWSGAATPSCTCWVYSDNNGLPGTQLGQVIVAAQNTWVPTWSTYTFTTPVNVGSSPFWILFSYNPAVYVSPLMDGDGNNGRSYVSADRTNFSPNSNDWLIHAVVQYSSLPANDLEVKSLDNPSAAITTNFSVIPRATIRNGGTNTLTNYNVQCTMTDSASGSLLYSQTLTISSLLPGEQTQLSYPAFTATQLGQTIYYKVKRTSGTDGNPANDSLVAKVYTTDLTEIAYDDNPARLWIIDGGGANADTLYRAVRFTPELPCSLVGMWHFIYRTNPGRAWRACSVFAWDRTEGYKNWPSDRYYLRLEYTPTFTGNGGWVRHSITPTFIPSGRDFWLGVWTPRLMAAQCSIYVSSDGWGDYGRSFYRWNPRDSASNGVNYTWLSFFEDWNISALVKYLGGPSRILRGLVSSVTSEDSLSFRAYLTKNRNQVIDGNVSGASITLLTGNQALWQFDAKHFWPSWNRGDTMIVIVDQQTNSSNPDARTGWYAVMNDTLLIDVASQTMNTAILRPIPVPVADTSGGGYKKWCWIKWTTAATDAGKPVLSDLISGYRVYVASSTGSNPDSLFKPTASQFVPIDTFTIRINTLTGRCSTRFYPQERGYYRFAIGLRYRGWSATKDEPKNPTLVSRYISQYSNAFGNAMPLSVTFANMSALVEHRDVILKWRTESEHNSYQWLVERSDDGGNTYVQIGVVPAQGNSTVPTDYEFRDSKLPWGRVFFYRLGEVDQTNQITYYGPIQVGPLAGKPTFYALGQAQPNPFNRTTTISYQLKEPGRVTIKIYSITGQLIKTLVDAHQEADYYTAIWDGTNDRGQKVAAGVYLYRMDAGGFRDMKKALYLR